MYRSVSGKAKERLFRLRCAGGLFLFFCLVFLLLKNTAAAQRGVAEGVRLCLDTLIPAMLPLLILAAFFQRSELGVAAARLLEKPTRLLFGVGGAGAGVVLFSVLGGFPAGASCIQTAAEEKALSRREGQLLQLLCFYPSAVFTVGAVGGGMLGSTGMGLLLEASVLLPLPLLGLPLRRLLREPTLPPRSKQAALPPAQAFLDAVEQGARTLLMMCAFVCLFSALPPVLAAFALPAFFRVWLPVLPELTGGIRAAAAVFPLPALAALLSFGGFCAHCQVLPTLRVLRLRYWKFFLFRLLHAGLSAALCRLLCRRIPLQAQVFAPQQLRFAPSAASSAAVSVCLVCMCALLLLGRETVFVTDDSLGV